MSQNNISWWYPWHILHNASTFLLSTILLFTRASNQDDTLKAIVVQKKFPSFNPPSVSWHMCRHLTMTSYLDGPFWIACQKRFWKKRSSPIDVCVAKSLCSSWSRDCWSPLQLFKGLKDLSSSLKSILNPPIDASLFTQNPPNQSKSHSPQFEAQENQENTSDMLH